MHLKFQRLLAEAYRDNDLMPSLLIKQGRYLTPVDRLHEVTIEHWECHCTADLMFDWFGFNQTSKADANSIHISKAAKS